MSEAGTSLGEALLEAFVAESAALAKYALYARRAEGHGCPQIARLFRAAARGKQQHAHRQLKAARAVGGMDRNLRDALELEAEAARRYPGWAERAREAGSVRAAKAFAYADGADRRLSLLFEEALAAGESGDDLPERRYLICRVCGYLHTGEEAPQLCPVCGAPERASVPAE